MIYVYVCIYIYMMDWELDMPVIEKIRLKEKNLGILDGLAIFCDDFMDRMSFSISYRSYPPVIAWLVQPTRMSPLLVGEIRPVFSRCFG